MIHVGFHLLDFWFSPTGKEFVDELLDSEEGQEEEEDEIDGFSSSDTEDGEKENDNICKDGKSSVSKARKKRKGVQNDSAATLKKTKSKAGEKSGEEGILSLSAQEHFR